MAIIEQEPRVEIKERPATRKEATIIEAAADLIERVGWIRHQAHNPLGYCVLGAIYAVCNRGRKTSVFSENDSLNDLVFWQARAERTVERYIAGPTISYWNDTHAKDKQQVVRTLREIAASLGAPAA